MRGRLAGDAPLAALVLLASGLVLAAPVAGRMGHPLAADLLMALAASCGAGSFALAAAATVRAARRHGPRRPEDRT